MGPGGDKYCSGILETFPSLLFLFTLFSGCFKSENRKVLGKYLNPVAVFNYLSSAFLFTHCKHENKVNMKGREKVLIPPLASPSDSSATCNRYQ